MNDLISIVRQYLESIACCDFQKIKLLLHEKYNYTGTDGKVTNGPDYRFETAGFVFNAFPDLSFEIINSYQLGRVVITELVMRGTHQGEIRGIPASDKPIAVPACSIVVIEDGLILSEREYYDKEYLLRQLGLVDSSEAKVRLMA